jgi:thymidylate synthase
VRTHVFQATDGREAVYAVCRALLKGGRAVSPRGQATLELSPVHLELHDPTDTLPTGINRAKFLPAIAAAEALQNVAGVAMPGLMHRISKFFPAPTARWDKGIETYGPRIGPQMNDVVELLRRDPESREAVASIWRSGDIVGGQAHNLCAVSLQFLVRDGAVDLLAYMRSNDAWYGLCYDLFQFAQVQATVARCLELAVGRYFHTAASLHLYERHVEAASELTPPRAGDEGPMLTGIGWRSGQPWSIARARALTLLTGGLPAFATPTEQWYADTLAPYSPDGS